MRKVTVVIHALLTLNMIEGIDLEDVLQDLEIVSHYEGADVEDWQLDATHCEVTDSR